MRASFPLRLKILVTVLLIVTGVVSTITFTMANLFHQDKKTYINDLVSTVSRGAAEEARALLVGYHERVQTYARVLVEESATGKRRGTLVNDLFNDFPELEAITVTRGTRVLASVHNPSALGAGGGDAGALIRAQRKQPLPLDRIRAGQPWVENASLPNLPCLVLATRAGSGNDAAIIEAVINLEGLNRLVSRSEVFDLSLWDGNGRLLAHRDVRRALAREAAPQESRLAAVRDARTPNLTHEYGAKGAERVEGVADVAFGGVAATAAIPKSAAYLASRDLLRNLMWVALGLLVAAALFGVFGAREVTKHLERLAGATKQIARGDFDTRVNVRSGDEIEALAGSFNDMAGELDRREKALEQAHVQLVQSEKLAAFGQLGAGIAHEVKNPLAGILACAQISVRSCEDPKLKNNLELIEKETKRCKTIIENLLRFARQEKAVFDRIDLNAAVEDGLAIVRHQLSLKHVQLESDLAADLPSVQGNANQLQQVIINLVMNAQQAIGDAGGHVKVTTARVAEDALEVRVADDGPGIPHEIQRKIFDPFFTTKPTGQGTGLGLSVTIGIVHDHGGTITIESEPGNGATFVIRLPAAPAVEGAIADAA
jgi:two-component system, NtrC family, sensor kinase